MTRQTNNNNTLTFLFFGLFFFWFIYPQFVGHHSDREPPILISKELNQQLNQKWDQSDGKEFVACLGSTDGKTFNVISFPELKFSNATMSIAKELCPNSASIHLHSHPLNQAGNCYLSSSTTLNNEGDIQTDTTLLNKTYWQNIQYFGVMCGTNQYGIFGRDKLIWKYKFQIV